MNRQSVSSSNIRSAGYEPETKILEIEFRNGSIYQYLDVEAHIYQSLISAASHGQYFASTIKDNYRYLRVQ
jgi:hypothetical protein